MYKDIYISTSTKYKPEYYIFPDKTGINSAAFTVGYLTIAKIILVVKYYDEQAFIATADSKREGCQI